MNFANYLEVVENNFKLTSTKLQGHHHIVFGNLPRRQFKCLHEEFTFLAEEKSNNAMDNSLRLPISQ
jgi:hypothetical protein